MADRQDTPLDVLWQEYAEAFKDYDDVTLGRWMAQTLGQLEGKVWRLSHPLMGAYRLACQHAMTRHIWLQRLVNAPRSYLTAECCHAPLLPLVTRDILEAGLICQHCGGTAVAWEDMPAILSARLEAWATEYSRLHDVAHWDESKRAQADYDQAFETAAVEAESSLGRLRSEILDDFLEFYPAVIWEDQDECLEIRPEDIRFFPEALR